MYILFLSVTWGVRCRFHLVRAVQRPGYAIFRGFHALLGKPDKVFFTFGGRKRKRGDTSGIVHSIGEKTVLAHLQHPEKGRCCKNATLIFRLSSGRRLHLSYPLWREMQTKCIRLFKIVKLGSCQHIDSRCCFTFVNQLKVKKKMTSITPRLNRSRRGAWWQLSACDTNYSPSKEERDLYALPFLGGRV